ARRSRRRRLTEDLNESARFDANGGHSTGHPRRRQQRAGIEDEIVVDDLHGRRAVELDELVELETEELHQPAGRQTRGFHLDGMEPDSSFRRHGDLGDGGERYIDELVNLSPLDEVAILDGDRQILEGGSTGCKHVPVEKVREAGWRQPYFSLIDREG